MAAALDLIAYQISVIPAKFSIFQIKLVFEFLKFLHFFRRFDSRTDDSRFFSLLQLLNDSSVKSKSGYSHVIVATCALNTIVTACRRDICNADRLMSIVPR
jgi:hypothetical protein